MIKIIIQEKDTILININVPSTESCKYTKQIVTIIKGEIENNTVIVQDFNTPLMAIHRTSRQKINNITEILNDKIDLLEIIDIYRTLHP